MALHTNAYSSWLPAAYDAFFAKLGQGLNAYVETRSRRAEIAALEAKSDEELAAWESRGTVSCITSFATWSGSDRRSRGAAMAAPLFAHPWWCALPFRAPSVV